MHVIDEDHSNKFTDTSDAHEEDHNNIFIAC